MWKRIKAWWAAERVMEELTLLDDRMLADIGLDRPSLRQRILEAAEEQPGSLFPEPDPCLQEVVRC